MYVLTKELEQLIPELKIPRYYDRPEELECWSERDFEDLLPVPESITTDHH